MDGWTTVAGITTMKVLRVRMRVTGSSLPLLLSFLKGVVVIYNLEMSILAGGRGDWVMEEQ